jgi:hypothetical protein
MIYIESIELESRGWVLMDCKNCGEEFLIPNDNPDLCKEELHDRM